MKVNYYATLRQIVGGKTIEIPVEDGATVRQLLDEMISHYPALGLELLNEDGMLHGHVHLFVNGRDTPFLKDGMDTVLNLDDTISVFPAVGGGGDGLTRITLKFTSFFRSRLGLSQTEFSFKGTTLRQFIPAMLKQFDIADLLMDGGELKSHVRIIINGRYSYLLGGWQAEIPDGAMVVIIHSYTVSY